jgi:hypothetical protein
MHPLHHTLSSLHLEDLQRGQERLSIHGIHLVMKKTTLKGDATCVLVDIRVELGCNDEAVRLENNGALEFDEDKEEHARSRSFITKLILVCIIRLDVKVYKDIDRDRERDRDREMSCLNTNVYEMITWYLVCLKYDRRQPVRAKCR